MQSILSIPNVMQAARLHGKGLESIRVETVPVPVPGDNQVLARVDAAGVCTSILKLIAQGSNHTFINGWDLASYPIIPGDEGCVTVVKAGRNVAKQYPEGRRFAVQPAVDHSPVNFRERYRNAGKGMQKVAVGYTLPGHLAEYMLITEETLEAECLIPLSSDDIPYFAGALCEPLSCVISAQNRHIHISQTNPSAVRVPRLGLLARGVTVIIGAGPMGRLHAEAALRFAPEHLIVVDLIEQRLNWIREKMAQKARKMNTTLHAVLAKDALDLLKKVSSGKGADDIIAAVANRNIQTECQQWLTRGGVLNLFGGLKRGEHIIDLDTLRVHYDEIRICGSSGGTPADMVEALRMVSDNEIDPGMHLAMVGSLDQFPTALELIKDTAVEGKIVLYPQIKHHKLINADRWDKEKEADFISKKSKRSNME